MAHAWGAVITWRSPGSVAGAFQSTSPLASVTFRIVCGVTVCPPLAKAE